MNDFKNLFNGDMKRYGEDGARGMTRKYLYYFRKVQTCNSPIKYYYRYRFRLVSNELNMEISRVTNIGKGLYIGHPHNITVSQFAILGENINIHKGVTIGQENRGKRKGHPTIGNRVWIGANSTIVGNIHIGEDVLIAPNTFVNCDIPPHSLVIGSPCIIKHRENATEEYVNNLV